MTPTGRSQRRIASPGRAPWPRTALPGQGRQVCSCRLRRGHRLHLRARTQLRCECRSHLQVAHQEGSLVEPPSSEPAGDFRVALTGVARTACRHDVVERVSPAAGDREDAVALQRFVGGAAVRASSPSSSKRSPLGCPAFLGLRVLRSVMPRPAGSDRQCGPRAACDTRVPSEACADCRTVRCSGQYPGPPSSGSDTRCGAPVRS